MTKLWIQMNTLKYITHVNLYTNNDVILCRVIPSSLKELALTWCHQLFPRKINLFDMLIKCFDA